jgi:hypothetical protein
MTSLIQVIETQSLPISKRTRSSYQPIIKEYNENEEYISATEFENFCENDLISDCFTVISKKFGIEYKNDDPSLEFLFKKGNEHEEITISKIREMTGLELKKQSSVVTSREYDKVSKNIQKKDLEKTIESMKNGEPIIYSTFLCDKKEKIRGIPDLIVRNDYLSTLFPNIDFPKEKETYYVPVEIKFSTIELCRDNKHILNKGRMKIYKTQLMTYCKILEAIQGKLPSYALIIGKRTILSNKEIKDSIEYPGFIDYTSNDYSYENTFKEGLEWLRQVKKNAVNWTLEDYKDMNLFPNMKSNNLTFYKEKKELSDRYGEITDLWRCSVMNRKNALDKGIYSWRDENFNSKVAMLAYPYQKSLDHILKVNRENIDYYPEKFTDDSFRVIENEMYVDFELVRDSFDTDSYGDSEWIFLIGVRYKGEYKSFMMNSLTLLEEKRVIEEFYNYLSLNDFPKCWYWFAEVRFWNSAMKRHQLSLNNIKWQDMYEIFTKEGFAVKGSMNFKLKSYIKNLAYLKKIDVDLPPENCSNGLSAMMIAWNYYNSEKNDKEKYEDDMKDVVYYNSLDCLYLDELLTFARNNL